jgi:O-antigen/teichoic acid export membrane protein
MKDLAGRSLTAFLWGAGGSIVKIILQFAAQVVLARLLGPAEYGLFALGVIIVGLSTFFSDMGLAYGLIQKKSVDVNDMRFVWTWQCILGISVSGIVFYSAGSLANLFAKPEAEFIFQSLSLVILINAVTSLSTNLLKKSLNFKVLQVSELSSYFLGFGCVGIPLAIAGYGGTSLVAAWLVQSASNFIILYLQVRHPLTFKFWTTDAGHMLRYGATALGTYLINWVLNGADKVLVGRIFSSYTVGLYTTAFNFVNAPSSAIYGNLQSIVFSACARLQDNHEALREVFLRLLSLITLVTFPLFILIAVGSEFLIVIVYGVKWLGAAQMLTPFALAMPFLLIWGISTPILWNSGYTKLEFRLQLPMVFISLAALSAVMDSSPQVVAAVAASLFALRCLVMVLAVVKILKISPRSFLNAIFGGIVLSLVVAFVSVSLTPSIEALDVGVPVQLLLLLSAGGIAYFLSMCLLVPVLVDERMAAFIMMGQKKLPHWTKPIVRYLLGNQK